MTYSEEQLTTIKQMAALYITPTEIAITLDVPEEEFKSDIAMADSPARKAYLRGKLSQKIETRKQMALLARVGSPVAWRCPNAPCSTWRMTNNLTVSSHYAQSSLSPRSL